MTPCGFLSKLVLQCQFIFTDFSAIVFFIYLLSIFPQEKTTCFPISHREDKLVFFSTGKINFFFFFSTGEISIAVDCEEVYQSPGKKKPLCSCGEVEEQILIMAKTAYKAIRRRDNTPASFEQFKKELSQTNEIVKESMEIMHTLKILCKHGDLDISYGSVIFSIRCKSMACLQEIWSMYLSGSLQSLIQRTFVTTTLLERCNVTRVGLRVQISEKEYLRCKRELGANLFN